MRLFVLLKIQHFTFLHRKILQSQLCRKLHQIFLYFDSTATECLSFMYLLIMMFYVITVLYKLQYFVDYVQVYFCVAFNF